MATKLAEKTRYSQLLTILQQEAISVQEYKDKVAEFIKRAETAVPQLFYALVEEYKAEQQYSAEADEDGKILRQLYNECRERIEVDCRKVWAKSTIRDALPGEAKDPVKAMAGKLGRQKQLQEKAKESEFKPADFAVPTLHGSNGLVGSFAEIDENTYNERILGVTTSSPSIVGDILGEGGEPAMELPAMASPAQTFEPSEGASIEQDFAEGLKGHKELEPAGDTLETQLLAQITSLMEENKRLEAENEKLRGSKKIDTTEGQLRLRIQELEQRLVPYSKDKTLKVNGKDIVVHAFVQPLVKDLEITLGKK